VKPPRFDYAAPTTLDEALKLLAEHGEEAKVLAGGQSLMPMLNMRLARPAVLVDVNRVAELEYIQRSGDVVAIGGLARQHDVSVSAEVRDGCPLVARALAHVGHPAIRYRGTICGSLAHADPAAEMPAVAIALGATMVAQSVRGTRSIAAAEFFRSWFTTALDPDELLVEVQLRAQPPRAGCAFAEVARRHGDFAQAGVAVTLERDGRAVRDVRLVALAAGPAPVRLSRAEAELEGRVPDSSTLEAAAAAASGEITPPSDIHSSADYKRAVLAVLVKRAVRAAFEEAKSR